MPTSTSGRGVKQAAGAEAMEALRQAAEKGGGPRCSTTRLRIRAAGGLDEAEASYGEAASRARPTEGVSRLGCVG